MENQIVNDTLISFLNTSLSSGDEIFERFSELQGAIYEKGTNPLERYLYVPGKNKNRVLLMAHTDTVWDRNYKKKDFSPLLSVKDGVITSGNEKVGIGADDRAGCAILWLLKDSGNSLLLLDGEEHGHFGAMFLQKNKKLMKEINNHSFVIQLDLWGRNEYKFHGVRVKEDFKRLIEAAGYIPSKQETGGADVSYVCKKAAGVNVSVGYENYHRKTEQISFDDFNGAYKRVFELLKGANRKHRILFSVRFYYGTRHKAAVILKPIFRFLREKFICN